MMPEQPNQSEELLKRYAQERRAQGGDFALHPATRQLLQGEVKRVHGTAGHVGGRGWLAALLSMRGRLALGSTLVAAVVLVITFWNQPPENQRAEFDAPTTQSFLSDSDAMAPIDVKRKVEPLTAVDQFVTRENLAREDTTKLNLLSEARDGSVRWEVQKFARSGRPLGEQNDEYFFLPSALPTNAAAYGAWYGNSLWIEENSDFLALGRTTANGPASDWGISSTQPVTYFSDLALDDYGANSRPSVGLGFGGTAASTEAKVQTVNDFASANLSAINDKSLAEQVTTVAASRLDTSSTPAGLPASEMERRRGYVASAPSAATPQPGPVSTFRSKGATEPPRSSSIQPAEPAVPVASRPAATMLAAAPDAAMSRFVRTGNSPVPDSVGVAPAAVPFGTRLGATPPPVLVNFSIEQSGSTVRVIDADGSIYEGAVETPPDAVTANYFDADGLKENEVGKKEDAPTRGAVPAQRPRTLRHRELSFRAAGSNATLRQVVIINGRLSERESLGEVSGALTGGANPTTKALPAAPAGATREPLKDLQDSRARGTPVTNHFAGRYGLTTNPVSTIEGTVRIGSTNQQWFRATRLK